MKTPDHVLRFENKEEWQAWLRANHAIHEQAWLAITRSHTAGAGVSYVEAVEEALCFGWIDGVMKSANEEFFFLRFSPRRRGSIWSALNRNRVEQLIADGRMTEAGLAKVREAQSNGEWGAALEREDTSKLPESLKSELDSHPAAKAGFDKLPASQKKQLLYWIASAKTEKTRQERIAKIVERSAGNE